MRKLFGFLLLFLAATACRDPLLESLPRSMREQDRFAREGRQSGRQKDSLEPEKPLEPDIPEYVPSVYATALHFQDSVNWRKDSLRQADLLFFIDGKQVLEIPVSSPPDPDRHRIWDGHLWSDSTDGHQTVVLCDGQEQFRFDGEEHLQGFLLVNGDVHTLGQHPGRDGFCYRINGDVVFESDRGSVLGSPSDPEWRGGALSLDGEDVFYSYSDQGYHIMRGGEHFQTLPVSPSDALLDLRAQGETVYRVERRGSSLYWIAGENVITLNVYTPSVISCKIIPYGDTLTVRGRTQPTGTTCLNWYLDPSTQTIRPVFNGQSARGELVFQKESWAFADMDASGRMLQLARDRDWPPLPEGNFVLATPLDLFVSEKYCAVALTSTSGSNHVIQSDLGEQSYSFNGYFTSVRIE